MKDSSWECYEEKVFQCFRGHFPEAEVKKNVHIKGRYSKRLRQIDILITEHTSAGLSQIVVDAKQHKRKLDIKAVEEFEGLVDDVGIDKGLLISNRGYTKPALRRAFYCPRDLELDILDFSELQKWQAFSALPYVGDNAFLVPAPFGWIVDISKTKGRLCNMFQRGIDIDTAIKNREFLYINFWNRKQDNLTAEELDKAQVEGMIASGMHVEASCLETIRRNDANTRLRCINIKEYNCLEITGFLEFTDIIFFAVLLTPIEKHKQNIRRLEHVMRQAIPVQLRKNNIPLINKLKKKLSSAAIIEEKSGLLLDIGHWYRDMNQLSQAKKYLQKSISLFPNYYNIKELLHAMIKLNELEKVRELIVRLLKLDPNNPTVFNDAIDISRRAGIDHELVVIFENLADGEGNRSLVKANCLFYSAQLLSAYDIEKAKIMLNESRKIFRKSLPPKHQVFKAIYSLNRILKYNK